MVPVSSHWLFVAVICSILEGCSLQSKLHQAPESTPLQLQHLYKHLNLVVPGASSLGTWGPWGPWSPCSRSCGAGVSTQSRQCATDPKKKSRLQRRTLVSRYLPKSGSCVGQYKRYQLCNTQSCPNGGVDNFRAQQCASYNDKQFIGKYYQWIPFLQVANQCELNCRPNGERFFATLAKTVIDGTPCGQTGTGKICIEGMCKQVGCDNIIGSGKIVDQCGVCGGDNSTCRIVSGLFTMPQLPMGYNLIASIPKGACKINITELRPSRNYLALRNKDGHFVINGNWDLNWSGNYAAVGTVFNYQRDEDNLEAVTANGPTNDILDMMVLSQYPNPGIKYEYTLPAGKRSTMIASSNVQKEHPNEPVEKTRHGHGHGSKQRGNSNRKNNQRRRHQQSEHPVGTQRDVALPAHHNPPLHRQPHSQSQSPHASALYHWKLNPFGECSATCAGGAQKTTLSCVKNSTFIAVADHNCDHSAKPEAPTISCNTKPCPPEWVTLSWSECSATCGEGVQQREIICKQQISPSLQMAVSDNACLHPKPGPSTQSCTKAPCKAAGSNRWDWDVGPWSKCSSRCGKGVRRRQIRCIGPEGVDSAEGKCDSGSQPLAEEACDSGSCQQQPASTGPNTWFVSKWSQCSAECGQGTQSRHVHCAGENCTPTTKPEETQHCQGTVSCHGKWFVGQWSQCSASCGAGVQKRDIICVSFNRGQFRTALEINCHDSVKPTSEQSCHTGACTAEWYTTDWGQCSKSCDSGSQSREVKCFDTNRAPSADCVEDDRPILKQVCNTVPCLQGASQGDSQCVDKYKHCHLVMQARLCSYPYYHDVCCNSCYKFR